LDYCIFTTQGFLNLVMDLQSVQLYSPQIGCFIVSLSIVLYMYSTVLCNLHKKMHQLKKLKLLLQGHERLFLAIMSHVITGLLITHLKSPI